MCLGLFTYKAWGCKCMWELRYTYAALQYTDRMEKWLASGFTTFQQMCEDLLALCCNRTDICLALSIALGNQRAFNKDHNFAHGEPDYYPSAKAASAAGKRSPFCEVSCVCTSKQISQIDHPAVILGFAVAAGCRGSPLIDKSILVRVLFAGHSTPRLCAVLVGCCLFCRAG